jgi:hypothetical protein
MVVNAGITLTLPVSLDRSEGRQPSRSMSVALAMPPPSHIVCRP